MNIHIMKFNNVTRYPTGLTVKELKELIRYWPEKHVNGENTEVWISYPGGVSNIVTIISPLNKKN